VSQSPVLRGDLVIVAPLGKKAGVVALKKDTGEVAWKSDPLGPLRYPSPRLTTIAGVEQVVVWSHTHLAAVSARDGKVLWKYGKYRCQICITDPLPLGDGRLFVTGGYGAGSVMLTIEKGKDGFQVGELFRLKRLGCHIHIPILHKGHLYVQMNTKKTHDGLVCLDPAGKVKWKTGRSPNFDWGGMILAGDLMLAMDGKTGILRLVRPNPEKYEELASAKLLGGKHIWAPMALSNGKLVLRDQRQMKCVVVGAQE
jgi:outer membrane protein assembly factor BamB